MLTLLIGKIDKVHTTCGHPDGFTIRESIVDGGYKTVKEALEENVEILFEEFNPYTCYVIVRDEHKMVVATGCWISNGLFVHAFHQSYRIDSHTNQIVEV